MVSVSKANVCVEQVGWALTVLVVISHGRKPTPVPTIAVAPLRQDHMVNLVCVCSHIGATKFLLDGNDHLVSSLSGWQWNAIALWAEEKGNKEVATLIEAHALT